MIHHDSQIQDSGSGSGILCSRKHCRTPTSGGISGSCSGNGNGKSAGCTNVGQPGWMPLLSAERTSSERRPPGRLLEPGPAPLLGRQRPGAAELIERGCERIRTPGRDPKRRCCTATPPFYIMSPTRRRLWTTTLYCWWTMIPSCWIFW